MTDYEKGIIIGITFAWPAISIGAFIVISIFAAGRR